MWNKVANILKGSVPIIATALGGPLPLAGLVASKIAKSLGVEDSPKAIISHLKANPQIDVKICLAHIESDKETTLAALEATTKQLNIVNQTMRNEANSNDAFVRRWRPFYGYIVGISWFVFISGLVTVFVYTAVKNPATLPVMLTHLGTFTTSTMPLWAVALAVLGVSVRARSADKLEVQSKKKSLIDKLLARNQK